LRRDNLSGPKSRWWQGGITEINRGIRGISKYYVWGKSVKKRDNYECQCCGVRNKIMHAHHIMSFIDHLDKALELDNGITFCESCHKDFHRIYGKLNIGSQQVKEFIVRNIRSK
jgi:hypothetical protein